MIDIQQLMAAMRANRAQSQRTFPPVVGRAPPQQPLPGPTMGNHMMPPGLLGSYGTQAQGLVAGGTPPVLPDHPAWQHMMSSGPYGAQAQQLAGLLGFNRDRQFPVGYQPGRFMPGFRPGIDTPITRSGGFQGGLGQPRQRY